MLNADMTGLAKQKEIANEETRYNKRQENVFKRIATSLGFLEDWVQKRVMVRKKVSLVV